LNLPYSHAGKGKAALMNKNRSPSFLEKDRESRYAVAGLVGMQLTRKNQVLVSMEGEKN